MPPRFYFGTFGRPTRLLPFPGFLWLATKCRIWPLRSRAVGISLELSRSMLQSGLRVPSRLRTSSTNDHRNKWYFDGAAEAFCLTVDRVDSKVSMGSVGS